MRRRSWAGSESDLDLVRSRALGNLVRPRIAVALQAFADLEHGEHAAHLERTELSVARHHGDPVLGPAHAHLGHLAHAGRAHAHVARKESVNLLLDAALVDA